MEANQSNDSRAAPAEALSAIYASHRPRLIAHLYRLTSERATAEDLCQETFLRAWHHWREHGVPASPRAWLYKVATHLAYDELRRQRRRPSATLVFEPQHEPTGQRFEEQVEQRDAVRQLLAQLSPAQACLLVTQAVEQLPIREVAARLGWPEGTVKSRTARTKAQLRRHSAMLAEA
jgi:RNA polymerase sigma-70 factor, ECF subfamily